MNFSTHRRVTAVLEHMRTISGKKDPITGGAVLEHINLGWFIHLGEISFGVGMDKPDVKVGDTLKIILEKVPGAS